jgi:adenylosuccinate lyase
MATETLLMRAALRGGDRQRLHETMRRLSFEAQARVAAGGENPLLDSIAADPDFRLSAEEVRASVDPVAFTGRAARQVDEFLDEVLAPALAGAGALAAEAPRV